MVKVNFFKSMKNNMSFTKLFIILGLLIAIIVILFSCANNFSVENFTPIGPVIDVMLWTDSNGSMNNSFVNTDWFELINTYRGFPNINFGQRKVSEIVKYLEPEKNSQFKTWDEASTTPFVPCITILVVDKGVKSMLGAGAASGGFFTGGSLTLPEVKKALGNVFSKNFDKLYTNIAPAPARPVAPVAPTAVAPTAVAPAGAAAAPGPTWMKLPGT